MFPFRKSKEYRISLNQDDWVAPEETLVDSHSSHSDLEQPIAQSIFRSGIIVIGLLFGVIVIAVFKMSIISHASYAALAMENKTVNFSIAPPRGLIFDNQGRVLVKNIPSFNLVAIARELPKDTTLRGNLVATLAPLVGVPADELVASVADNVKKNALFVVADDLSKEKILAITQLNPKGFYVVATTKREYVDGHQFSTVMGYTGKVNRADLERDDYYQGTDSTGRAGIEAMYEKTLRGTHGRIFFEQGGGTTRQEPGAGQNLVLNINQDVQKNLYQSLFDVLRGAGLSNAAAVVQDPHNGAVLGMVSFPGYDNNIFSDNVSPQEFQRIFLSKSKPLFNRAVSGLYNPGSTIKPFMGMAGLQEGVISSATTIQDCVALTVPNPFNPDQPSVFKNWREDLGSFNLRRSIADSCNVFFYILGGGHEERTGLGISRIVKYLQQAFADTVLGIDLPGETAGFVPTPEWKKKTRNENWFLGDTYNTSIGQGDLSVTPLWINTYVSAIANGGTIYKPQVANRITDADKNPVKIFEAQPLGKLPFKDSVIREMKSDMAETVRSGTAKALADLPISVGAKTGTAEVVKHKSINALFTAFAPLDNPEVAITVLVEGSPSNEGYAIRAAHEFLRRYFTHSSQELTGQ